jgi:[ribosomal protein S5]-alanine N-acetyltransferase
MQRSSSGEDPILTSRLSLQLIAIEALTALVAHDLAAASHAQGFELPSGFVSFDGSDDFFLRSQLERSLDHPDQRGWCARAMVRAGDGVVIGSCGFHGPPPAVGRAEIGYTVLPPFRGQGFAVEAASALVEWAWLQGERVVFASVSPDNAASLAVVRKIGFVQTGVQMDEIDGEELVFEIAGPRSRSG